MALKSEKHAVGNAQRAENPPTIEETDLTRRENCVATIPDLVVVKQIPVHLSTF
jgi:hypothetical protein